MPLDIEDTTMLSLATSSLDEELRHLDCNGWNTRGEIRRSSITRWSMITSMILEDVLEVLLSRNLSNVSEKIR
jgi:hypothetical protein